MAEKRAGDRFTFDPDWVIAPGEMLDTWATGAGLSTADAARATGFDVEQYQRLVDGEEALTGELAARLADATRIPARLWRNMERIYRQGLTTGKNDLSRVHVELDKLAELGPDWDGHGAEPVTSAAVQAARALIDALMIVPQCDGGLQLEGQWRGWDAMVSIQPDGHIGAISLDRYRDVPDFDPRTPETPCP